MNNEYEIIADLSIPIRFNGPQPNAFGVAEATSQSLGDTRTGSSVNFEQYTLISHCNGTHTECVGHITDERISILDCLRDAVMSALLISVPTSAGDDGDLVITAEALHSALADSDTDTTALIVRTLPNDDTKLTRRYDAGHIPAYFTADAMDIICGFTHLLTDLPSIDRLHDEGKLRNHRIFWDIPTGSQTHTATRILSTITELIYVPNKVQDGRYTLNLQIAPFAADAAPSRPVLLSGPLTQAFPTEHVPGLLSGRDT
ncbi:MAG: cyclase family protein [Pyrinomonadaceae bacterium]|nr:cyclase family protein [Pyrinomonadaceae bacterium]